MTKKADKEKAAIDALVELDHEHKRLINCCTADPVEIASLAVQYMHKGMKKTGERIMQEAWERDIRISVPTCGIIVNTETTGYGGTNETDFPVRVDHRVSAPVGLCANG